MEIIGLDENQDPNVRGDEDAGKAAFKMLNCLVSRKRKHESNENNAYHLPGCLSLLVDQKCVRKYPCSICGKLFHNVDQLVVHSDVHSSAENNPTNECCFCGRMFDDSLKLGLHQLAMPIRHQCKNCLVGFEDYNQLVHHACRKVHVILCR